MMTTQDETPEIGMQFDQAEDVAAESTGRAACAVCKNELGDTYYTVNGAIACPSCREKLGTALTGGSGLVRFCKAALFGILASLAGFALYFGVLRITGYQVGLIAIVVGAMVGKAVNAGSGGRGGFVYQIMAIFLVYSVVVASYTAEGIAALMNAKAAPGGANPAAARPPVVADGDADAMTPEELARAEALLDEAAKADANPDEVAKADADGPDRPAEVVPDADAAPAGGDQSFLMWMVTLIGMLYAIPVRAGLERPIGLLIVGFALWEAWKLNNKTQIAFAGPFRVADPGESGMPAHA